jgi:hypothetical protein
MLVRLERPERSTVVRAALKENAPSFILVRLERPERSMEARSSQSEKAHLSMVTTDDGSVNDVSLLH